MQDFTFFLCLLSHLGPCFGNGFTSSKRLSLLVPEISRSTGALAKGTGISWLWSSFSIGITDDGSQSSSLKASLENGHIPSLAKGSVVFFAVKEAWYTVFVNDPRSWIVTTLPGLAVIQSCCATCNFPLNGPITPTSSGCNRWQQWGRKVTYVITIFSCIENGIKSAITCMIVH